MFKAHRLSSPPKSDPEFCSFRDDVDFPSQRRPFPIQHVNFPPLHLLIPLLIQYSHFSLDIGLFGLCGIVAILAAYWLGKLNDYFLPWTGTLCGLLLQLSMTLIAVSSAGLSVASVVIVCMCKSFAPFLFLEGLLRKVRELKDHLDSILTILLGLPPLSLY